MSLIGHNKNNDVYDITLNLAKESLEKWYNNFTEKITNNHWDILFPEQRHIHGVVQSGLTSFGTFWEKLSEALAKNNGYKVITKTDFNKNVPLTPDYLNQLRHKISSKINAGDISIKSGIQEIKSYIIEKKKNKDLNSTSRTEVDKGKGIDFWFKKDGHEILGDIKSPQENIGNAKKLVEHILIWSAYRLLDDPSINLDSVIVFPYNPFGDFEKYMKYQGNKMSPLKPGEDFLMGNDFWKKISGVDDAMDQIFRALKFISKSDEIHKYKKLFEYPG